MAPKKKSKDRCVKPVFGVFFGVVISLTGVAGASILTAENAYAEPETSENSTEDSSDTTSEESSTTTSSCENSLGALGWLVCPSTGKISEAVDWLYDRIEQVLVINPVYVQDGQPLYEIWKYFRALTNVVFIIFLMIVIYSQITGVGITNYGVKRALPKLIVAAVMVNLSFIICSVLVDVSNIVGSGLRGLFESRETATMSGITTSSGTTHVAMSEMYTALAGGTALGIGAGVIAFETGAIWMLIPVALGAVVAVATGLITIALRQAVVALLVMISPLAIVMNILPNTEKWYQKWNNLLFQMLIFYPMFSLLFGASSIAGWAIIVNSMDGFGLLLGTAVQIFPLFYAWKLMQMSGTFLGTINQSMRNLAARPLMINRGWAESHRALTQTRNMARSDAYTPSLRLQQFLYNRRTAREEETRQNMDLAHSRGVAYAVRRNYKNGDVYGETNARGERSYANQARSMRYRNTVAIHAVNMDDGTTDRSEEGSEKWQRMHQLDMENMHAADEMSDIQARGEAVRTRNTMGQYMRKFNAINAHQDEYYRYRRTVEGEIVRDENGNPVLNTAWKDHFEGNEAGRIEALSRYQEMNRTLMGNQKDIHTSAAISAQSAATQAKLASSRYQTYFAMTPPTHDLTYTLMDLARNDTTNSNIDIILDGLRTLNNRGDTDLEKDLLDIVLDNGLYLGSHAAQSIASFSMAEVKGKDPGVFQRFGKYVNLETARAFNENDRKEMKITWDEYATGHHTEPDGTIMYAKKSMIDLMNGTSLKDVERTAYDNMDKSTKKVFRDENGVLAIDPWLNHRTRLMTSIEPEFISATISSYASGGEQLLSAIKYWTGYSYKQMKHNGHVVVDADGTPVSNYTEEWLNSSDYTTPEDQEKMRDFYEAMTERYIKDQTASQILNSRSDFKIPFIEHLSRAWFKKNPEDLAAFNGDKEELDAEYDGRDDDESLIEYMNKLSNLKTEAAGNELRRLLSENGVLEQIYRSSNSGAANGAKGWLREMLKLNNKVAVQDTLRKNKERQKKEFDDYMKRQKEKTPASNTVDDDEPVSTRRRYYTESDYNYFAAQVRDLYDSEHRGGDGDGFFEDSIEIIRNAVGTDSLIETKYRQAYRDDPNMDARELRETLIDLFNDGDNYPDAE